MNANFERSGTFPFSVQPAKGYGSENPTPETVIVQINYRGKALKVADDLSFEYVDFADATVYPDPVVAARKAGEIAESLRAARRAA